MIARRILGCLLIVSLVAPSLIASQRLEPPAVWRAFAEKLDAGAPIRVRTIDHKQIKGHFVMVDGDTLRIRPKTRIPVSIRDVKFTEIESIARQNEGWSPAAKVVVGIGIGAGVVFVVVAAMLASWD